MNIKEVKYPIVMPIDCTTTENSLTVTHPLKDLLVDKTRQDVYIWNESAAKALQSELNRLFPSDLQRECEELRAFIREIATRHDSTLYNDTTLLSEQEKLRYKI